MAVPGGASDLFSDICRLCGNQQRDNFNIFGSEGKKRCIQNKIKLKIDIDITQDDPLPKVVCRVCYERLELFCRFQEKCHETQETLMNIFLSVVESCTSDDGAVDETEPNLVFHFVDASSVGQDDEFVTTMMEVPVVSETAEKSQHGSAGATCEDNPSSSGWRKPVQHQPAQLVAQQLTIQPVTLSQQQMHPTLTITTFLFNKEPAGVTGTQGEKVGGAMMQASADLIESDRDPGMSQDARDKLGPRKPITGTKKIYNKDDPRTIANRIKRRNSRRRGKNPDSENYVYKRKVECETMVALYIDKMSNTEYRCKLCSQVFRWNCKCEEHVRRHTGEKPSKCDICGKRFILNYYLRVHLRVHQNIRFSYDLCDKSFTSKSHLRDHLKCHQSESRYVCDLCGYKCITSYNFSRHVRSKHQKQQQYICDICGKVFTNASTSYHHIKRHHVQLQGLMSCSICNKNFGCKQHLRNHMTYHNAVSPYSCEPCSMSFKTKRSLSSHTRWIHPTTTNRIPEKVISDVTSPNAEEGVAAWHKAVGITVYKADVSDTVDDTDMEECIDRIRIEHKALRTYQRKPKCQAVGIKKDLLKF